MSLENYLPPQNLEIERQVLSEMLLSASTIQEVIEVIDEQVFYHSHHQATFTAICKLFQRGIPVDELTVGEQLKKDGVWVDPDFFIKLYGGMPGNNSVQHCHLLKELYIKRELIKSSAETYQLGHKSETDVFELLSDCGLTLYQLLQGIQKKQDESLEDILIKLMRDQERGKESLGVLTGYPQLDRILGTFQNSDLIILAGATSMGKTAMGLSLAWQIAKRDIPVGIISLEMPKAQVAGRFKAIETGVSLNRILGNRVTPEETMSIIEADDRLAKLPIFIDDSTNLNSLQLRAKAIGMVRKRGIKILFVDYLQLLSPDDYKMSREQQVSQTSRKLKTMAMDLQIPVICLCQLSRKVETREKCVPRLSDLRESGAIEQDADVVMFIYRPEYYDHPNFNIPEDGIDSAPRDAKGKAVLKIAKHRNGPLGYMVLDFDKDRTLFSEEKYYSKNEYHPEHNPFD